jgi:hypothetical protein
MNSVSAKGHLGHPFKVERGLKAMFKELLKFKAVQYSSESGNTENSTERQTITQYCCSFHTEEFLTQELEELLSGKSIRVLMAVDSKELDNCREDFITVYLHPH